jgi:hypothetical protein
VRRLISNKPLWQLHLAQHRADEIRTWAAANGIDPDDVSTDHYLLVDHTEEPVMVRYVAYLRTLDGAKYVDASGGPAVEDRAVPLVVEPSEHWPTWALADERPQP